MLKISKREIPLGEIILGGQGVREGIGVCRHQSILTQVLAHEIGLDCSLISGKTTSCSFNEGHMWNVIKIDNISFLFDPRNRRIININNPNFIERNLLGWYTNGNDKKVYIQKNILDKSLDKFKEIISNTNKIITET